MIHSVENSQEERLMGGLIPFILCDIDFYDEEAYAGTSYAPFIGFMIFFVGMVVVFVGAIKLSNAKKQWNLFYDQRDAKHLDEPQYVKEKKIGKILIVVGIVLMLASFILLPL
jgi:uncharacterized membrane protein